MVKAVLICFILCVSLRAIVCIINGNKIKIEEAPYVVTIESSHVFLCNGALITNRTVLTAYDCGSLCLLFGCKVRVGHTNLASGGYLRKVVNITRPEQSDCSQYVNCIQYDLALLKLEKPVKLSTRVQTIPIAGINDTVPIGSNLIIAGFGTNNPALDTKVSRHLISGTTEVQAFSDCKKEYQYLNSAYNFCADYRVCIGDLGAAAILNGTVVGIVTYKVSCNYTLDKNTTVLINVIGHNEWIRLNTEN